MLAFDLPSPPVLWVLTLGLFPFFYFVYVFIYSIRHGGFPTEEDSTGKSTTSVFQTARVPFWRRWFPNKVELQSPYGPISTTSARAPQVSEQVRSLTEAETAKKAGYVREAQALAAKFGIVTTPTETLDG